MVALNIFSEGANLWNSVLLGQSMPFPALFIILFLVGIGAAASFNYLGGQPIDIDHINSEITADNITSALEKAPFPIWSVMDGEVAFANSRYHDVVGMYDNPEGALKGQGHDSLDRNMVNIDGSPCWFHNIEIPLDAETFTFSLPIDQLVSAENSLNRLMETLSTTFAHLPVGLAIFDTDQRLTQFNPAISKLLNLEPTWLAMRPSMSAFLEKLRENRHLPEQNNFLVWRRLLTEMNVSNTNKNYADNWSLPNGHTLHVTAQAHSKGATTFLFEDITAQVAVERQHHAETTLNQAVLDRVSDAIVVINPAGNVAFANAAFDRLFAMNSTNSLDIPDLQTLASIWPDAAPFWNDLQSFVSQLENRAPWAASITLLDQKSVDIFPMPDGSTLVSFSEKTITPNAQKIAPKLQTSVS